MDSWGLCNTHRPFSCAYRRKYVKYVKNIEKITFLCYNKNKVLEKVVVGIGTVSGE